MLKDPVARNEPVRNGMVPCRQCPVRSQAVCGQIPEARLALGDRLRLGVRHLRAKRMLQQTGDLPVPVFTLQSGWAFRFRLLPDGRRQILTFYLPGDLIGIHVLADLPAAISGVRTVTESWVCVFDRAEIRAALIEFPDARTKFEAMRKERILMTDELVIDLGRRSAEERIVRLILEFYARLQARRAVKDDSFEFPIRQEHLADALGLTVVHVSRTLGSLRAQKLISFTRNRMTIIDLPRITALGALDKAFTDYLLSPDAA